MIKKSKIIFIFLILLLVILSFNKNVFATSQYDLTNFTEEEKETAKNFMTYAKNEMAKQGYDIEDLWYFVVYSNAFTNSDRGCPSSTGFDIYILNPQKNNYRVLTASRGIKQNGFNYMWGATCFVGGSPSAWWSGLNDSRTINSLYGFSNTDRMYVIANNVTGDGCNFISRTFTETYDFFQVTPPKIQPVEIMEITQVEEIPKAIAEVMKMIIPIGLVVLSAVLIIYLVHLVISRAI